MISLHRMAEGCDSIRTRASVASPKGKAQSKGSHFPEGDCGDTALLPDLMVRCDWLTALLLAGCGAVAPRKRTVSSCEP